ncbi:MAG: hypothetical protein H6730_35485 [Deltaproteobacteria bacterium]|nr:hypothetical protein [Deltaproteobacteria bacterium]
MLRDWAGPFEEVSEEFEASRKDAALPADLPGPGADEPPRARAARALRWVQDKLRRQPFRWDRQHIRPVKEVVTDRSGTSWERSAVLAALLEGMGLVPRMVVASLPEADPVKPRPADLDKDVLLVVVEGESLVLDPGCDACGVDEVRPALAGLVGWKVTPTPASSNGDPSVPPAPAVAVMERTLPLAEATPRAERLTLALSPRGVMLKRGEVRLRGVEAREINRRFSDGPRDQSDRDAEAKRFLDAWADGEVRWQLGDDVVTAEVQDVLLAREGLLMSGDLFSATLEQLFGTPDSSALPARPAPYWVGPSVSFTRQVSLQIPAGGVVLDAPDDAKVEGPLGYYSRTVRPHGRALEVEEELRLPSRWYTSEEHAALGTFFDAVTKARDAALVLRVPRMATSTAAR